MNRSIPGVLRYISTEAVEQGIKNTLVYSLYPVVVQPTKDYSSLSEALTNTSIPPTGNGKAIIQQYLC